MKTIPVLATLRFTEPMLRQIEGVSPLLRVTQEPCHDALGVAEALAAHPDTQVLYTFGVPDGLLTLAPHLRWVQLHSAGADHLLGHPLMHGDVLLTTSSGIHATPIAEYVLASMLSHRWQVARWTRCQREKEWPSGRWALYARPELRESTLGIVGYGSIGREVGRLAQSFGMRVLAMSRSGSAPDRGYSVPGTGDPTGTIPERFYPPEGLLEMLSLCDYVVLSLPHTPQTTGLIGDRELRAMKPDAYLVNISRGAVLDEAALVRALREHWIAGAGLDVFEREPLPADSPLWDLDNALLSPHVSGFTPRYDERAVALFVENLRRYLAGEPLLNLVDKAAGY